MYSEQLVPPHLNDSLVSAQMPVPSYSPADYYKIQSHIEDVLNDLREIAPALNDIHRQSIFNIIGRPAEALNEDGTGLIQYDIDQVTSQYALVQKIRAMVLDPNNNFHERTDAKGLSALVNAINGTINLFIRTQDKIEHLKKMQNMREATVAAIKGLPPEVQTTFINKLEELDAS